MTRALSKFSIHLEKNGEWSQSLTSKLSDKVVGRPRTSLRSQLEFGKVRNAEEAHTYYLIFNWLSSTRLIFYRKADGCGATVSEAKSEAAARVVDELLLFVPADRRLSYKQVVKTDPNKDILYILNGICTEYKLKTPSYNLESKGKDGYKYTAYLGELSASGTQHWVPSTRNTSSKSSFWFNSKLYRWSR